MRIILLFLSTLAIITSLAQSPKREMRAVWVATVANIDFPKSPKSSVSTQKKEICNILDQHQADGINAIFFQVRPAADAFYQSELEPWSRYLNGTQGKAPQPFYDPLTYIINEAHKRNMELHAWINPFRVRLKSSDKLTADHPYSKHKWWGWNYGGKTFFDPGIPEVRDHTKKVVLDIVSRYDIDGIHFDDYFYPYRTKANSDLPDSKSFRQYGGKYYPNKIEDWRRNNVNTFIRDVSKSIKKIKPWVKFGISPFGIWKNSTQPDDKLPTKNGTTNYDILYADVIKWMREGWVDYCAPQLYWAIGFEQADYSKLLAWWDDHTFGRNMYIGHSLYKIDLESQEEAWRSPVEIERQIKALRKTENISGSVFYSSKHLIRRNDVKPLREALRNNYYKDYALMPEMPWIDNKAPSPPRSVQFISSSNGNRITWEAPRYNNEMNKAYWYVIYQITNQHTKTLLKAENILTVTQKKSYSLPIESKGGYYVITALDRLQNESRPQYIEIQQTELSSVVFRKYDTIGSNDN